ncbi:MAG: hypothetical protein ACM3XZ_10675 [Betaproteobacteria bacterium]
MKIHPVEGQKIIAQISRLQPVAHIVRHIITSASTAPVTQTGWRTATVRFLDLYRSGTLG